MKYVETPFVTVERLNVVDCVHFFGLSTIEMKEIAVMLMLLDQEILVKVTRGQRF